MGKELWQFIADRLARDENVMLLVVAQSTGSSPGRAGYKMAVTANYELRGSIGGGVMEVRLVEEARTLLSEPGPIAVGLREQVHQKNSPDASGMICSGKQIVLLKRLTSHDLEAVNLVAENSRGRTPYALVITSSFFILERTAPSDSEDLRFSFSKDDAGRFHYRERLDCENSLYIIGGGHCALALSQLMSKLDFRITILDDRHELNTIEKNEFANDISIIDSYEKTGDHIPSGADSYVVVMTLGYHSDKVVMKALSDRDFKYLGVLGSKAKMTTLIKELKEDGLDAEWLARIHAPIGLPINSRTPEEIAVSVAAEIIAVKNAKK